jgi:light-regulated signal transduction histidine kinase (bacteriophytochrome)
MMTRTLLAQLVGIFSHPFSRTEPCVHDECELNRLRQSLEARESERVLALQHTVDELERESRSVSHDLRSPLGAVKNFAAILAQNYGGVLDAPAHEYLRRITSNVDTAVTLIDGMLEFSRSGREEIHKASVDMRRLVENVCDHAMGTAAREGSLEIEDLPSAYADPEMMRRVFTNLISNAWKFVEPGAMPRVAVGGERTAEELVYFVRDQGIGFDMRSCDRLFNEFERLHESAFEGHGMGLAMVARLVRRQGGRVWARGEKGKGATFLFSLPLPPPRTLDLEAAREQQAATMTAGSGHVALVLPGFEDDGSCFDPSNVETFVKEHASC